MVSESCSWRSSCCWAISGTILNQLVVETACCRTFHFRGIHVIFWCFHLYHSSTNLTKQELLEIMRNIYLDLHHCVSINLSTSVVTFDMGFISSKVLSSFRSSCPFVLPMDILINLIWPRCLLRVQEFCQAWLLYPWSDLPLMSE